MDAGVSLARFRVPMGWALGIAALVLARPSPALFVTGLAIAAAGESLRLWAAGHLEKDRALTTGGPYAWTRNPLYLGSLLVGLGFALATGRFGFVALLGVLFVLVYRPVMKREARRLAEAFPEAYGAYAARVPLFWPRLGSGGGGERFSWARVRANREHVTVLGLLVVAVILGVRVS